MAALPPADTQSTLHVSSLVLTKSSRRTLSMNYALPPEIFRTSGLTKSQFSPILDIRFYERRRAECPICTLQRVLFWFRGPVCRFCAPGSGDKRPCFVPCCALLRQERRFLFIAAVPLREKAVTVSISTSPGNQKKGEIFYGKAAQASRLCESSAAHMMPAANPFG